MELLNLDPIKHLLPQVKDENRLLGLLGCVNALSGYYLISTKKQQETRRMLTDTCQCPLGLLPHFYKEIFTKQ